MPEPVIDVNSVLADLKSEMQLYTEMIKVSEHSFEALMSGDAGAVGAAIDAKQEIMAALDRIDSRLRPVKAAWRETGKTISEPDRARIEEAMKEVQSVLAKLIEIENRAQKEIEARREDVLGKLKGMQNHKNVRKAYGGPKPDSTRFLDEQT
ncbi:MAG: flagellar export chaperone FlgN [Planctomycetota bacterium]|jgi:uncharacterized protein YukE